MSNGPHPTMAMPAPSRRPQGPKPSTHPRRPPAQSSVSLRHAMASARANNGSTSTSSGQRSSSDGNDSPSSLKPRMGRDSSGESSNAENWFDKTNNEVREGDSSFSRHDHSPPFFIRNPSSEETPLDDQQQPSGSLPLRTELLQLGPGNTENSAEEFRDVIDDLTVQNMKLKRRLKRYEKLHDAHLKDAKLFEVRIHGLPSEKKRELEDMLRKFASSLGTNADNAFPTDGYSTLLPMLNKESSQATLHQTDSAYASMSLSGPGSSAVSASDQRVKNTPRGHLSARQKNIHSYLHDIPVGLLPQEAPTNMTERAKKKLVVRKMEQLFVGKGAVGGHQQPLQQQEVSQSAARADSSARAQAGQTARSYGAREAPMLYRKKSDDDNGGSADDATAQARQELKSDDTGKQAAHLNTEQRPTQPIDLDPDRAQIPQDNIKYMRAMGFSPPHLGNAPQDGHGWIYINFLFNMAQLHTLHVTPDFARDAMSEISKRFEVSPDGRKVRWRGGKSVTHTNSSGDGTPDTGNSGDLDDSQSPRKRMKLSNGNSSDWSRQVISGASKRVLKNSRHAYTPMFHHKSSDDGSEDSSSEEEESEESDVRWDTLGGSSAMTSSGVQASTTFNFTGRKRKKPKRDDGPIIFYNNVRFCTDLSGERRPTAGQNAPMYTTFAAYPIGGRHDADCDVEGRGPLAEAGILSEAMELDDNPTERSQELSFPSHSSPSASSFGQKDQKPIDLEVTGIGGVWPEDNFILNVETRHAQVVTDQHTENSALTVSKILPPRFASILAGSEARNKHRAKIGHEVTGVEVTKLQPTQLPPALGFMDDDDESSYEDSDDDEDMSPSPHAQDALPPEVGIQPVDFAYRYGSSDNGSDADDDSDEDSDDGEVDLLAGIRAAHPEFVRAQEREYDANMAERLAEEIPAGSSAATAGGGSGFGSPRSTVGREEVRQARAALRARPPPRMKRNDSTATQGHGSEGSNDDDDGMSDI